MKKRGYFFTLDAFIAIAIITAGMLLILSAHSFVPYPTQTLYLSEGYIDTIASVKIYEVNNPYVDELRLNGQIKNPEQTLLEQVGEFYVTGRDDLATNLVRNITHGLIPEQYGFELLINKTRVYNQSILSNKTILLVSSKRIVSGIINRSELWTLEAEMRVWQA